jgi:hypothetical protein
MSHQFQILVSKTLDVQFDDSDLEDAFQELDIRPTEHNEHGPVYSRDDLFRALGWIIDNDFASVLPSDAIGPSDLWIKVIE